MKFSKLIQADFDNKTLDEMLDMLDEKTRESVFEKECFRDWDLLQRIADCESPIERLLIIELDELVIQLNRGFIRSIFKAGENICYNVMGQSEVVLGKKKYRVDMVVQAYNISNKTYKHLAIECDGHDFHEKTKEQVQRDKERDRTFTKHGLSLIRFSGSEIYKDARKCANEAMDILQRLLKKE